MLNEVPPTRPGINLRYRTDGGLFNLARFRARSNTSTITAHELQVSTDKSKVSNQQPPGQTSSRTNVGISGEHLDEVDYFPHLGSILSKIPTCGKDIANRIKAAHCAYGRLSHSVFSNHAISIRTKTMVFRAIVLSTLLCAYETWTLYSRDIKRLDSFQQRKLRQLLTLDGRCDVQTMKSSSVLGCLLRKPPPCNTVSAEQDMSYGWTPPDCLEACSTANQMKKQDPMEGQRCGMKTS